MFKLMLFPLKASNLTGAQFQSTAPRIAKAWSKNVASAWLGDGFVLSCHKDKGDERAVCYGVVNI